MRSVPRILRIACAAVALPVVVNGCSGGGTEPARVATTVVITPSTASFTAIGQTQQFAAVVKDQHGDTLVNAGVTWSSGNAAVVSISSSGLATAVANGTAQVTATSGTANQNVNVTVAQVAASILKVSGDAQTGTVAQALAQQLVVVVRDANSNAIANLRVNFTVTQGAGTLTAAADTTDATGQAQVTWTLGQTAGAAHQITAALAQGSLSPVTFSATARAGVAATITVVSGNNQSAAPSTQLANPIVVKVVDQFNNNDSGVTVNFAVTAGGGSVNPTSAVTGANGQAQTAWTLGGSAGAQTMQASASGVTGVQVTVNAVASVVQVTAVAPNPIIEGQSATITGTGFDATPANNTVAIAGVSAVVTAASATQLSVTVPTLNCQPARSDTVQVTVGASPSNKFVHPRRPASFVSLAVGQQMILKSPSDLCLQFDRVAAFETYLIGVQSTSETPSSLTPITVTSVVAPGGAPSPPALAAARQALQRSAQPTPRSLPRGVLDRMARLSRHSQAHLRLREREEHWLTGIHRQAMRLAMSQGVQGAIPPAVNVGDSVDVKVPNINSDFCANFIQVRTVVRAVGTRGVWLEDVANPASGFTPTDINGLSALLDNPIFDADTAYFGAPSDLDGNSRIAIVITKEVNKFGGGILGFVVSTDRNPSCASTNGGELYYAIAPDTAGQFGFVYGPGQAKADAPILIAHEFTHIIQDSRRAALGAPIMTSWTAEGQATLAEEVVGHAVTARAIGQNYGFAVAFNSPQTTPTDWYLAIFADLAVYYGFRNSTTRNTGAPEECTFLQALGPCVVDGIPGTYGRLIYGVPASILRWMNDQFGPTYAGGEKGLQKALVNSSANGFANLSAAVGVSMDTLLAQWAAMLYVDDRVTGAAQRLTLPSWNLVNIESGLVTSARLQPRDRPYDNSVDNINVRAGSNAYFRTGAATHAATAIRARTSVDAALPSTMQMWVVRMQ